MQPTDIQTLRKGLQGIDIYLLLHQKALRVRLLATYGFQSTLPHRPSSLSRVYSRIVQTIIVSRDLYGNYQASKGINVATKQHGTKHYFITPDGIAELQQHLQNLKQARVAAVKELRELTSQSSAGSALEDSTRAMYQDRALHIDNQIVHTEHILSTAKVLHKPTSKTQAQLGSRVTIELNGKKRVYTIVGSIEADPERGKVSNESPLGQSLLGKKVNDYFVLGRRGVGATVIAIE